MSFWMPPKYMKQWQKIRTKGRIRFILINGMVHFGISMFIVNRIIYPFILENLFGWKSSYAPISLSIITWLLMGLLFGVVTWWLNEKSYLQKIGKAENK